MKSLANVFFVSQVLLIGQSLILRFLCCGQKLWKRWNFLHELTTACRYGRMSKIAAWRLYLKLYSKIGHVFDWKFCIILWEEFIIFVTKILILKVFLGKYSQMDWLLRGCIATWSCILCSIEWQSHTIPNWWIVRAIFAPFQSKMLHKLGRAKLPFFCYF